MNEHDSRSTNDSPFELIGTIFVALSDALNLRHMRSELYGDDAGRLLSQQPTTQMPTTHPRLTVVGPSWSVPPSLTQQNLSDQQLALQTTPFDRVARRHRV